MEFELLDGYLLRGTPAKSDVVAKILAQPPPVPGAAAFYQGLKMLGARTPDLSLIALRLVLAGKKADDEAVLRLRTIVEAARAGGDGGPDARERYYAQLDEKAP